MLFNIKRTEYATTAKAEIISPRLISARSVVSAAFPKIEPETEYPFATGAEWSTHDLISHILETTGPAHLVACTWSMEAHAAEKLMTLLGAGNLLSVSMLVDWRVQVRTPHALKLAEMNFARIRVTSCHAKVFACITIFGRYLALVRQISRITRESKPAISVPARKLPIFTGLGFSKKSTTRNRSELI